MATRSNLLTFFTLTLALCGWSADAAAQDKQAAPDGFESIFNGRDLEGWEAGETKDPKSFEGMSEPDWYHYRKGLYGRVPKHWRVEAGELIGTGAGPDLVTWDHYGDFEMRLEWKVSPDGHAGICLRRFPEIKLCDTASKTLKEKGADKGSGGLSRNKEQGKFPSEVADKPAGQWNKMVVQMVGPYVTVILNGKKVLDNVGLENAFEPGSPIHASGPIHLRTLGGQVRYRNISIRKIHPEASNAVLDEAAGDDADFTQMFNGKDFTGWIGATNSYELIEGGIRSKRGQNGRLVTDEQYSDFVVRFEFKLPPGGNNGLMIRAPGVGGAAVELQVLDDTHVMHKKLKPYQYHGSAYGIAPARRGYLRPVGKWNHQEVSVKRDHVRVVLNGYLILDTKLKEAAPNNAAAAREQGHFGFTSHLDPVAFRHVRIKELP